MVDRTRARYLAPAAIIVALLGAFMVVRQNTSTHSPKAGASRTFSSRSHRRVAHGNIYVVQAGDSLTGIAAKTGISLATLESLNHTLDPNSLQAGKQLRLRK